MLLSSSEASDTMQADVEVSDASSEASDSMHADVEVSDSMDIDDEVSGRMDINVAFGDMYFPDDDSDTEYSPGDRHPSGKKQGVEGYRWDYTSNSRFLLNEKGELKERTFHYFPYLPKEIQVAIWNLLIEEYKKTRPFIVSVDPTRILPSTKLYTPLLEVCVCSRQEVRRHFPCALTIMHVDIPTKDAEVCRFSPCALGGQIHISLETDMLLDLTGWWRYQDWHGNLLSYQEDIVDFLRPHQFALAPGFKKFKTMFEEHRTARSVGYTNTMNLPYLLRDMVNKPAAEFMSDHPIKLNRSSVFNIHLATKRN